MKKTAFKKNEYLINLEERHSVTALIAGLLVFCCTMTVVAVKIKIYATAEESPLHYFTVQSNLFSAVTAAFMMPYAVEGIRKKRFSLPRWIVLLQYASATCVAITMMTTLLLLLPLKGAAAVSGTDFWLHLVTPLSTVILFQCVESGKPFTRTETFLIQIPYWCYLLVYFVMVVVIGKERGGWSDFYMMTVFCPVWVSALVMLSLGAGVAFVLRILQNKRSARSWDELTRLWHDDMDPTELYIEAFGLGRYMGKHCDVNDLTIPLVIFKLMEERYGVSIEQLTDAFVKGALDAVKERPDE